ncbi:hypothetical protein F01_650007 [Burkholderia cenocepacia]|nr:hypothetical protein F01_650007 [Burkholderia cenocepacia]
MQLWQRIIGIRFGECLLCDRDITSGGLCNFLCEPCSGSIFSSCSASRFKPAQNKLNVFPVSPCVQWMIGQETEV